MEDKISAWYIPEDNRDQVYFCSGGVLRWITFAANSLRNKRNSRNGKSLKEDMLAIERTILETLQGDCDAFVSGLSIVDRNDLSDAFPNLIAGKAFANNFKPLYDCGVVARVESTEFGMGRVKIVSTLAAAAAQRALSK